ncbi:MAG: hypothetical protein D6798_03815, partial [Deltaproteobacteria bacterium]
DGGEERLLAHLDPDDTPLELVAARSPTGPFAVLRCARSAWWGDGAPDRWRQVEVSPPAGPPLLARSPDGGIVVVSPRGPLLLAGPVPAAPSPHREALPPAVRPTDPLHGLEVDGRLTTDDGWTWAWQDDGVLVRSSTEDRPRG